MQFSSTSACAATMATLQQQLPTSKAFKEGSTQCQILSAIEILSSYGRFVPEEKVFELLKMMRQSSGAPVLGQVELHEILKFLTNSGVLEMSNSETFTVPNALHQLCGGCDPCGGGCGGCGRYYRIKIGAMH
uniref:Uncharacterized protein n=1 Tax=Cacopsylla melanoneura TaxID=428564 RepID=A0A8D9AZP9_9HEMI